MSNPPAANAGKTSVGAGSTQTDDVVTGAAAAPLPLVLFAGMVGAPNNALSDYLPTPPANWLDVYGEIVATTIEGGVAEIEAGGAAQGSIDEGGLEFVASGGSDTYTRIRSGVEVVDKGGVASADVVEGAAATPSPLALWAGAVGAPRNAVFDYLVENHPAALLDVYGLAKTEVIAGGIAVIESGGATQASYLMGGLEFIAAGATDRFTTIRSGVEVVDKGGVASADIVEGAAAVARPLALWAGAVGAPRNAVSDYLGANRPASLLDVYGALNPAVIRGGVAVIESGGAGQGSLVEGGLQFIASGARATYTTVKSGVDVVDKGGVAGADIVEGAAAAVHPLAWLQGSVNALSNYLGNRPASLLDDYGAIHTTTIRGGVAIIEAGGSAQGSVIAGGLEFVASGGVDTKATVEGGVEVVDKGGVASGDLVEGAGAAYANSANVAYLDVYGQSSQASIVGGEALIEAGGVADSYAINNGYVEIFSGGSETGVASVTNGVLKLDDGSTVQGSIALGQHGQLVVDPVEHGLNVSLSHNSQSVIELLNVPAGLVSLSFAEGVLTAAFKGTTSTFNLANATNLDYALVNTSQGAFITLANH